jgi:actin-like ATPase involved in cell morphogenesis
VLTGGGALLKNLDKRLMIETGLPVVISTTRSQAWFWERAKCFRILNS